jgi:hypothetical protein
VLKYALPLVSLSPTSHFEQILSGENFYGSKQNSTE